MYEVMNIILHNRLLRDPKSAAYIQLMITNEKDKPNKKKKSENKGILRIKGSLRKLIVVTVVVIMQHSRYIHFSCFSNISSSQPLHNSHLQPRK